VRAGCFHGQDGDRSIRQASGADGCSSSTGGEIETETYRKRDWTRGFDRGFHRRVRRLAFDWLDVPGLSGRRQLLAFPMVAQDRCRLELRRERCSATPRTRWCARLQWPGQAILERAALASALPSENGDPVARSRV